MPAPKPPPAWRNIQPNAGHRGFAASLAPPATPGAVLAAYERHQRLHARPPPKEGAAWTKREWTPLPRPGSAATLSADAPTSARGKLRAAGNAARAVADMRGAERMEFPTDPSGAQGVAALEAVAAAQRAAQQEAAAKEHARLHPKKPKPGWHGAGYLSPRRGPPPRQVSDRRKQELFNLKSAPSSDELLEILQLTHQAMPKARQGQVAGQGRRGSSVRRASSAASLKATSFA